MIVSVLAQDLIVVVAGFLIFLVAYLRLTAPRQSWRNAGARQCACTRQVPVHLSLTGHHVANLCRDCGRQVYIAKWVYRGE
jgi:hypothetical protein